MEFLKYIQHRTSPIPLCPHRREPRRFFGARNLFRFNSGRGRASDCFADAHRVPEVKRTEVRAPLTAASPAGGFSQSTLASSLAGRHGRAWLILLVILLGTGVFAAQLLAQAFKEYDVKAAFLYHLAEFVEWPPAAFPAPESPLVIGVLGADPFGKSLDEVVKNEEVKNRKLDVRRYRSLEEVKTCHILFISQSEAGRLDQIFSSLKDRKILTVGDTEGFAQRGGIVRFLTDKNKIRLRINLEAAKAASLTISSKLLRAADVVGSEAEKP
jgi:YfiR/HmsC-like